MRYLSILILAFSLILCSCNHNEPALEIVLPIYETYVPATIEVNTKGMDEEQKRNLIHLVNTNHHIVNSAAELPDDPIGFSEAYNKINFKNRTLLIKYMLHDYSIDTYNNRYYRNTKENSYNWMVNIGASNPDVDTENTLLTRFAILVNKLPADADLKSWYGLTHLGWFPE